MPRIVKSRNAVSRSARRRAARARRVQEEIQDLRREIAVCRTRSASLYGGWRARPAVPSRNPEVMLQRLHEELESYEEMDRHFYRDTCAIEGGGRYDYYYDEYESTDEEESDEEEWCNDCWAPAAICDCCYA